MIHMDVGSAASHREQLLSRDAFAVSNFRQTAIGSGSLMMYLRNLDRQQAGSYSSKICIFTPNI
jgi:hypothetical protein